VDAVEGKLCYGRTDAFCDPAEGRRKHGVAVPGVWNIPQDRLSDRARRPFRYANQLPEQVEAAIVSAKREKPHWGARRIRERLVRRLPHAIRIPAASTIHAVPDRHGLVTRASRPRTRAEGTSLSDGLGPNGLWCTDYKGEFQLGDKFRTFWHDRHCEPT